MVDPRTLARFEPPRGQLRFVLLSRAVCPCEGFGTRAENSGAAREPANALRIRQGTAAATDADAHAARGVHKAAQSASLAQLVR